MLLKLQLVNHHFVPRRISATLIFHPSHHYFIHPSAANKCPSRSNLLDSNLLAARSWSLGDNNRENTILQAGLHCILIHSGWERERSRKFANRAFREPVLLFRWLWLVLLDLLVLASGLLHTIRGTLILYRRLVGLVRVLDLALFCRCFDISCGTSTFFSDMLGAAFDGESLAVGELDVDVLLFDTRQLRVDFVALWQLLHINLGRKGLEGSGDGVIATAVLNVSRIVICQPEERLEGGELVLECSWEERHFACCWFDDVVSGGW